MSHDERRNRRKQIALAVQRGEHPAKVAQRFQVSWNMVRVTCLEFQVPMPRIPKWERRKNPETPVAPSVA